MRYFGICPNCDSCRVTTKNRTELIPYEGVDIPVKIPWRICLTCQFEYRDSASEDAIEQAIKLHRQRLQASMHQS